MLNGSLLTSVCLINLCRENAPAVSDPTTVLNRDTLTLCGALRHLLFQFSLGLFALACNNTLYCF